MIASHVSRQALENAARAIGVRVEVSTINAGSRHRVKLYPDAWEQPDEALTPAGNRRKGERGNRKYQRTSASAFGNGRRVHAVCWHGFRDFFREVFKAEPGAWFRTSLDVWKGRDDFENRYRASGWHTVGAPVAPYRWVDVCACPESGEVQ